MKKITKKQTQAHNNQPRKKQTRSTSSERQTAPSKEKRSHQRSRTSVVISREAKEPESGRSARVSKIFAALSSNDAPGTKESSDDGFAERTAEGTLRGSVGTNGSARFRKEALTAERNEINRTGLSVEDAADRLRDEGHEVRTAGTGKNLNRDFRRGQRRYRHHQGRSYRPSGTWEAPHDVNRPGFRVRIGEKPLEVVRATGENTNRTTVATNGQRIIDARDAKGVPQIEDGSFSTFKESLEGLTRREIRERLAIDHDPRFLQRLQLRPGSEVNLSNVGPQNLFESGPREGGGVQFHDPGKTASTGFDQLAPERLSLTQRIQYVKDGRSVRDTNGNVDLRLRDLDVRAQRGARALRGASRVLAPVGVALDAYQLGRAFQQDGNKIGEQTVREVGSVAGGWGGALLGAKLGASVGALGGPVGAVVGGVVGGVIGGFVGSAVGEFLITKTTDLAKRATDAVVERGTEALRSVAEAGRRLVRNPIAGAVSVLTSPSRALASLF